MGQRIKKGKKGAASQYITRSNAIRKLQLPLQDFRRLCILKGIYPREPKRKLYGSDKTYFHVKDLKILEHDTLLSKFHSITSHLKKYKALQGRKLFQRAEEWKQLTPRYSLSNVIKERYPTFIDALRDMDDALCLISLFANFPQHLTLELESKDIEMANKLYKEWMTYCTVAQCFKKAFFSIKGIYYQVEIMGQNITWVAPFQFNQRLPFDIDYKVIGTFREFYTALLRFVNYKLYSELGMQYPPQNIQGLELDQSVYISTPQIQKLQAVAQKKFTQQYQDSVEQIGVSEEFKNTPEMLELTKKHDLMKKQRKLFSKCVFLFNRETPIYALQYLVLSFGGSFYTQDDELKKIKVTHHVLDRPLIKKVKDTEYVQPQYLVDCLNNLFLLPVSQYSPGISPPAHLSPFTDDHNEGYMPMRQKEIKHLKGEEVMESEDEEEEVVAAPKKEKKETKKTKAQEEPAPKGKGDADSSSEDEQSEEEDIPTQKANKKAANARLKKDLEVEQKELAKVLMTNR